MISASLFAYKYKDVPTTWIFEYYCRLEEKLDGQTVKIHSLFKSEKTPSMKIFFSKEYGDYFFKDYSSGYSGSAVKLVMHLFKENFVAAASRIVKDYNLFILNGGVYVGGSINKKEGFKVTAYKTRKWTIIDKEFWIPYNISSRILEIFNVRPLEEFIMTKEDETLTFREEKMYGYFTSSGELYKIYRPGTKLKFITVRTYLQGIDQLKGYRHLLICSSLKDIMSVYSLGLKVDCVSGESENSYIPEMYIKMWQEQYPYIGVMLDNDPTGIKCMKKYRTDYGLTPLLLPMSKDISDSVKDYGPFKVRNRIVPLIHKLHEFVEV